MEFDLFGVQGSVRLDHGLWLREHGVDGLSIVHASRRDARRRRIVRRERERLYAGRQFIERVESARATLQPGAWLLEEARVTSPGEPPTDVDQYLLATDLTPEQLAAAAAPPQGVPFWDLPEMTEQTADAGLDARGYRLQFQRLLARPLLLVAMVLVAAAFSLRFFRFGGIAKTLAGGVAAGFVLYIATEIFSDLGGAGTISPSLAAWSPALVGTMLGTLSLLHSEDG